MYSKETMVSISESCRFLNFLVGSKIITAYQIQSFINSFIRIFVLFDWKKKLPRKELNDFPKGNQKTDKVFSWSLKDISRREFYELFHWCRYQAYKTNIRHNLIHECILVTLLSEELQYLWAPTNNFTRRRFTRF